MPEVLSVAQLTLQIRALLENQIGEVWVEGEISNHRLHSSGHQYFTLKDERSQIQCVFFRGAAGRSAALRDGMQVQILGEVTVYEQRGNYQILVQLVQPKGLGGLQARFEALKRRLAEEGLFDEEWKKPIPRFPRVVALVTSPTGAAIRDMLNILTRRAPWLRILVYPVRVQGQGGETEIARAIEALNRAEALGLPCPDTIVVGRGGGSLEDLWNFNEEVVARAIFASAIPVISAVGHEIDFTIADFVADLRAPTPSAAAELLAPDGAELRRHFDAMQRSLAHRLEATLERHERILALIGKSTLRSEPERQLRDAEQRVDDQEAAFLAAFENRLRESEDYLIASQRAFEQRHPCVLLAEASHRVALGAQRLDTNVHRQLERCATALRGAENQLRSLGPQAVLARGFSMTLDVSGRVIMDADQVAPGDRLVTHLAHGRVASIAAAEKDFSHDSPP